MPFSKPENTNKWITALRTSNPDTRDRLLEDIYKNHRGKFLGGIVNFFANNFDVRYRISREEALGLYHDAFLIMVKKIMEDPDFQLHQGVSFSTFLFSIGKNQWRNQVQKAIRVELKQEDLKMELALEDRMGEDLQDEMVLRLRKGLRRLQKACQLLIREMLYEGKAPEVMAEGMGVSYSTFRKRKQRCFEKLREMVQI